MAGKKNELANEVYKGLKTTSKGNIYIHLNPVDNGIGNEAMKRFADEKIQQMIKPQIVKMKKVANEYRAPSGFKDVVTFLDQVKGDYQEALTASGIEEHIITTGRRNIFAKKGTDKVVKDVEASFANLMMFPGKWGSKTVNAYDLFQTNMNEAGEIVDNYSNYIQFINEVVSNTNREFDDKKIEAFIKGYLESTKDSAIAKGAKGASGGHFSECFKTFFEANNKKFIKVDGKNEYRQAEETFEQYAIRLRTYQKLNEALANSLGEKTPKNIRDYNKRLLQGVAVLSGKTVNSLGGYLYEPLVKDMTETAANGLMSMLKASVAGSDQVKIEGPDLQKKMGMKHTKSKPDVLLSYVEGEGATVSIIVPGASIKAFTPRSGAGQQDIKIRTGATIREIYGLSLSRKKEEQYLLANVLMYGGSGLPSGIQGQSESYLGSAHALYALAGTLQKFDTAYFMILNGTVLTVPEVLRGVVKGNNAIKASFQQQKGVLRENNAKVELKEGETIEDAAERRSEAALIAYMAAKTDISLLLDSKMLVTAGE